MRSRVPCRLGQRLSRGGIRDRDPHRGAGALFAAAAEAAGLEEESLATGETGAPSASCVDSSSSVVDRRWRGSSPTDRSSSMLSCGATARLPLGARSTCCARSRAAEPLADRAACAVRAPIRDIPRPPMPASSTVGRSNSSRNSIPKYRRFSERNTPPNVAVAVAVRRSRERRARQCWWRFARGSTGSIASRNGRVPSAVARRRLEQCRAGCSAAR